jgi:hypothetical protein
MKWGIDLTDPSTLRGAIWAVAGIIGTVLAFLGKDPTTIGNFAMIVAGGLGVTIKSN